MSVDTTAFREFGPKFAALVARLWVRTFSKSAPMNMPTKISALEGPQHITKAMTVAALNAPNIRYMNAIRGGTSRRL